VFVLERQPVRESLDVCQAHPPAHRVFEQLVHEVAKFGARRRAAQDPGGIVLPYGDIAMGESGHRFDAVRRDL
jgi:hypothetical protein